METLVAIETEQTAMSFIHVLYPTHGSNVVLEFPSAEQEKAVESLARRRRCRTTKSRFPNFRTFHRAIVKIN